MPIKWISAGIEQRLGRTGVMPTFDRDCRGRLNLPMFASRGISSKARAVRIVRTRCPWPTSVYSRCPFPCGTPIVTGIRSVIAPADHALGPPRFPTRNKIGSRTFTSLPQANASKRRDSVCVNRRTTPRRDSPRICALQETPFDLEGPASS